MSTMRKVGTVLVAMTLIVALGAGCKRNRQAEIDFEPEAAGPATPTTGVDSGVGTGLPNVDQESLLFSPATGLQAVYFDYDSSGLRPDALATLSENAQKIREVPGVMIQLAGHCDERGTQEYNLALGERRALSVRDHLIQLGVEPGRLITISYGEEFPAATGSTEAAYAQNRRVEFNRAQ